MCNRDYIFDLTDMHAKVDQQETIKMFGCQRASERNEVNIMALKKLNQFNYFDAEGFFLKLVLIAVGKSVWKEYGSDIVKGTKVEVVIASDKHNYNSSNGEVVNNMYEKLTIKVPKNIDVPMNAKVRVINPEASIYGEYRNQLSVVAEDIEVLK